MIGVTYRRAVAGRPLPSVSTTSRSMPNSVNRASMASRSCSNSIGVKVAARLDHLPGPEYPVAEHDIAQRLGVRSRAP